MNQSNKNFHLALVVISFTTVLLLYFTRLTSVISIATGLCAGLSIRLFLSHKKENFATTKELDWILLLLFSVASLICYFTGLYVIQGPLLAFVGGRSLFMFFKMYGNKSSDSPSQVQRDVSTQENILSGENSSTPPQIPQLQKTTQPSNSMPPEFPMNSSLSSQSGEHVHIPEGVKGWSWGAFLLSWIWAIGNRTWIGLLALIPYLNIVVMIWLGIKGRELAWKNSTWRDLDHFNSVQRKWSQWGLGIAATSFVLGIAIAIGAPAYQQYKEKEGEAKLRAIIGDTATQSEPPVQIESPDENSVLNQGNIYPEGGISSTIVTSIGEFVAREHGKDQPAITLNGTPIFQSENAQWHGMVRGFKFADGKEAILMMTSGGMGNSCEALFFFIYIEKTELKYTPQFGTCSIEANFKQTGKSIEITMPKMGGNSIITFDGSTIIEDGKKLPLNLGNDPSI